MALKWYWVAWLVCIFASFALGETYGYIKFGVPGTFTHFMRTMSQAWGLWTPLWCLMLGGLVVHFWWANSGCGQ